MNKRITRLVLAALFVFVSLGAVFTTAPRANAEENKENNEDVPAVWLQISPVSNYVTLKPGSKIDYAFSVSNIGSETFSYHVYSAPYTITDENYNVSFNSETNRTQIARWIKFLDENGNPADTLNFTINPGEKQNIRYRIDVPDDVPAGGQYATIFAESNKTEGDVASSNIKTVSRLGLIVYGRTDGDTVESANIVGYDIPRFMTGGNITATSRIENAGNTDFEANYNLEVKSVFGRQLYTKTSAYNILPDTTRRSTMSWDDTPMMGFFQVHYSVSAIDGQVARDETHLVVIMPIFAIVLSIILLTLIIIWIIILVRKRRERKSRLLV